MSAALALDANPVRTVFAGGREVEVRFTAFAQARCLALTLFGHTPQAAVERMLDTMGLGPRALRVRAMELGDVVLLRRMPLDAPLHLEPGAVRPAAFVDGLSEQELAAALAAIAAERGAFN